MTLGLVCFISIVASSSKAHLEHGMQPFAHMRQDCWCQRACFKEVFQLLQGVLGKQQGLLMLIGFLRKEKVRASPSSAAELHRGGRPTPYISDFCQRQFPHVMSHSSGQGSLKPISLQDNSALPTA